jgi:ABC-type multidrug transport system ATPase subunit/ABC-type multidrug transport system permease subunit
MLHWESLDISSANGSRQLLKDVSGSASGGLTACMGASGAGKTTLLNLLACRLADAEVTGGSVTLQGAPYSLRTLKALAGYVVQDDLVFGQLSVREALLYTAQLRMGFDAGPAEHAARVDEVMRDLELTGCADALNSGISGGERKRLCVAMELLTRPSLLFLDEPTSGLDAVSAVSLMTMLKRLADRDGCTILCTIHQPPSGVFGLFDNLIVLDRGQVLYHGPANEAMAFYADAGFECPPLTNPADHVLDVVTPSNEGEAPQARANAEAILARKDHLSRDPDPSKTPATTEQGAVVRRRIGWLTQFSILFKRSLMITLRSKTTIFLQLVQAILMGLLVGAAFFHIGHGQKSVTRRQPLLFFCVVNQGVFGALLVVNSFPSERAVVVRERMAGTFNVSAYFTAKVLAEGLVQLLYPTAFSVSVYFLAGLGNSAGQFFVFLLFMQLCSLSATSLAIMIAAITRHTTPALSVLPLGLEVSRLFGGFFLSPKNLPRYFAWLDALSYVKYCYVGISLNELHGLKLTCAPSELKNGVCPTTTGQQTIALLGLDFVTIPQCAFAALALIVAFRVIAYIALRLKK